MNELIITQIGREALKTALLVAAPALLVSMIVGLAVSVFQVVTSLQDQTIAFVPKAVAVTVLIVALGLVIFRPMIRAFMDQFLGMISAAASTVGSGQ